MKVSIPGSCPRGHCECNCLLSGCGADGLLDSTNICSSGAPKELHGGCCVMLWQNGVGVTPQDDLSCACLYRPVEARGCCLGLVVDNSDSITKGANNRPSFVGTHAISNDDVQLPLIGHLQDGVDRRPNAGCFIAHRNHNADRRQFSGHGSSVEGRATGADDSRTLSVVASQLLGLLSSLLLTLWVHLADRCGLTHRVRVWVNLANRCGLTWKGFAVRRRFLIQMAVADAFALVAALSLASLAVFSTPKFWVAGPTEGALVPLLLSLFSGAVAGRIGASYWVGAAPRPSHVRGALVVLSGMLGAMTGIVFVRDIYWSRAFLGYAGIFWLLLAILYRSYKGRRPWEERLLVVSTDEELIDDLRMSPNVGEVIVLSPDTQGELPAPEAGQVVVVDFKDAMGDRMAQFVSSAVLAGRRVRAFSSVYEEHTGRIPVVHLAEGWELQAPYQRVRPWLAGKRAFDLVMVLGTVVIWGPLLLLGMAVVAVRSKGPIFFTQLRVGLNGQPFTIVKLRTMVVGAEDAGPQFASDDDLRIYPGGAFLRKYRLDEIPQLWNVLSGDLSLVGPRPEQVPFVEDFNKVIPFYDQRHVVRPGATGWAQINTGYATGKDETFEKLTYDLFYVKHMSPLMDLQVIFRSIRIVLRGVGWR